MKCIYGMRYLYQVPSVNVKELLFSKLYLEKLKILSIPDGGGRVTKARVALFITPTILRTNYGTSRALTFESNDHSHRIISPYTHHLPITGVGRQRGGRTGGEPGPLKELKKACWTHRDQSNHNGAYTVLSQFLCICTIVCSLVFLLNTKIHECVNEWVLDFCDFHFVLLFVCLFILFVSNFNIWFLFYLIIFYLVMFRCYLLKNKNMIYMIKREKENPRSRLQHQVEKSAISRPRYLNGAQWNIISNWIQQGLS